MRTAYTLSALSLLALPLFGCPDDDGDDKPDSGVTDTGPRDTGPADSGTPDTGPDDTGTADTGADAGEEDTGMADTGVVDLRIPDLEGPVEVSFDQFGVLHASCQTDRDCIAVEGYFHAAHRFGQMDLRRRFAKGEIAEILPLLPGIEQSRFGKTIFGNRAGDLISDQLWTNSSTATQAMMEAYARGVNAWIEDLRNGRNNARLTDDWAHLEGQVEEWAPQDSIACVLALIENLTNQSGAEIAYGEVFATLPSTAAADLFTLRPASSSSILNSPFDISPIDRERVHQVELLQARLRAAKDLLRQARERFPQKPANIGSNNWVVGPSRTAEGKALLANDPHLGMDFPSVWYLAHLDAKTNGTGNLHAAGASFPGLPGIVLGQNEAIAWGATTTFFDMSDVYVEELNEAGDAVIFNDVEVPIVERTFPINVMGGQPIDHVVRYVPHHGPILFEDPNLGIAISLKWTAQDATTDADFLLGINLAGNIDEARAAFENVTTVGQNWVVIDTAGNFGWFPYNAVPSRPWATYALPSWLPLPGDGTAEWEGVVPYADLPQAMNVPEGFIATANNDMTGHLQDGDPTNDGQAAFQAFVAPGYRHQRIAERMQQGANAHTRDTMSSIQADNTVLLAEVTQSLFTDAIDSATLSPDAVLALEVLIDWDFRCPTGLMGVDPNSPKDPDPVVAASSIGCTAYHAFWPRLEERTFTDELLQYGSDQRPRASTLVHALNGQLMGSYWDDVSTPGIQETLSEIATAALEETAMFLTSHPRLGPDPDDWRWGRVHTVTLQPAIFPPSSGTFANDGGLHTVDVAVPASGSDFSHGSGPSMRLACDADAADGVRCTMELPGGQRHFGDSPHFADLLQRWLVNDPIPLHFLAADVEAAAVERLTVLPAE
jgi:penicillin amidase